MTYLPSDYINENYHYYLDNNKIIIENTQQECIDIYPTMDYIHTDYYFCENITLPSVSYSIFSDNIYYRMDLDKCLIIFLIIFIFCILIPYKIFSRFFGRWLKV